MKLRNLNGRHLHTISSAIAHKCDGADYERGALETANATADNVAAGLSEVIELLHTKKVINDTELLALLGYGWEDRP